MTEYPDLVPISAHFNKSPDASLGATTSEMPFPLNGQQPGDYHIHLAGVGSTACQVDSDPFKMNAAKTIQQATTNNLQQTGSNTSDDAHKVNPHT